MISYTIKQPPRGVPRKSCSENMQQIYRRTPMPKCDFKAISSCKATLSNTSLFDSKIKTFNFFYHIWFLVRFLHFHGLQPLNLFFQMIVVTILWSHFWKQMHLIIINNKLKQHCQKQLYVKAISCQKQFYVKAISVVGKWQTISNYFSNNRQGY